METKLVLVLREGLAPGVAANAAAVLALSLAAKMAPFVGADGTDASGTPHAGLNTHPVPVVTASAASLRELHDSAARRSDLTVVAFLEVARLSRGYDEYLARLATTTTEDLDHVGVAVFGPRGPVTKLTKRLALLA